MFNAFHSIVHTLIKNSRCSVSCDASEIASTTDALKQITPPPTVLLLIIVHLKRVHKDLPLSLPGAILDWKSNSACYHVD